MVDLAGFDEVAEGADELATSTDDTTVEEVWESINVLEEIDDGARIINEDETNVEDICAQDIDGLVETDDEVMVTNGSVENRDEETAIVDGDGSIVEDACNEAWRIVEDGNVLVGDEACCTFDIDGVDELAASKDDDNIEEWWKDDVGRITDEITKDVVELTAEEVDELKGIVDDDCVEDTDEFVVFEDASLSERSLLKRSFGLVLVNNSIVLVPDEASKTIPALSLSSRAFLEWLCLLVWNILIRKSLIVVFLNSTKSCQKQDNNFNNTSI